MGRWAIINLPAKGGRWDEFRWVPIGLAALIGLIVAGVLVLVVVSLALGDALFERRFPWISVPATIIVGLCVLWLACRNVKLRRGLFAKVRIQVLTCPSCGGRLPLCNGSFRRNPHEWECIDWIGTPPESFRVACDRCGRDAWFYVYSDGTVARTQEAIRAGRVLSEDSVVVKLDEPS